MCVSVALLLLVQTTLAQPITGADEQNRVETVPVRMDIVMEDPEHLAVKDVLTRRKRSVNLMQAAMRALLSQAIEAIPTEGEDRLITNEICMNNTCFTLEMDLRDLMEEGGEEEEEEEAQEEEEQ